jgi:NAD(P)-dependent dehydrogenase (short-subunit alcohol dehydrogenase family)
VKGSVSNLADLDELYAAVKADIVFANAGTGSLLPLGEITAEHIDQIFDTNVKGTIFTVQKALPLMGQGGSIILTGSSAGTTGARLSAPTARARPQCAPGTHDRRVLQAQWEPCTLPTSFADDMAHNDNALGVPRALSFNRAALAASSAF